MSSGLFHLGFGKALHEMQLGDLIRGRPRSDNRGKSPIAPRDGLWFSAFLVIGRLRPLMQASFRLQLKTLLLVYAPLFRTFFFLFLSSQIHSHHV
jgi:hypothetical protein